MKTLRSGGYGHQGNERRRHSERVLRADQNNQITNQARFSSHSDDHHEIRHSLVGRLLISPEPFSIEQRLSAGTIDFARYQAVCLFVDRRNRFLL